MEGGAHTSQTVSLLPSWSLALLTGQVVPMSDQLTASIGSQRCNQALDSNMQTCLRLYNRLDVSAALQPGQHSKGLLLCFTHSVAFSSAGSHNFAAESNQNLGLADSPNSGHLGLPHDEKVKLLHHAASVCHEVSSISLLNAEWQLMRPSQPTQPPWPAILPRNHSNCPDSAKQMAQCFFMIEMHACKTQA